MARLSAENYVNSPPTTPHRNRKSSRFKALFGGSGSRSPLQANSDLTSSTETSPLGARNEPGNPKLRLLPSERVEKSKKPRKNKSLTVESSEASLKKQTEYPSHAKDMGAQDAGLDLSGVKVKDRASVDRMNDISEREQDTQTDEELGTLDLTSFLKEDPMKMAEYNKQVAEANEIQMGESFKSMGADINPTSQVFTRQIAELLQSSDLGPDRVSEEDGTDMNNLEHSDRLSPHSDEPVSIDFAIAPMTVDGANTESFCDAILDSSLAKENDPTEDVDITLTEATEPHKEIVELTGKETSSPCSSDPIDVTALQQSDGDKGSLQIDNFKPSRSASPVRTDLHPTMIDSSAALRRLIAVIAGAAFLRLAIRGPEAFFVDLWRVTVVILFYAAIRNHVGGFKHNLLTRLLDEGLYFLSDYAMRMADAILEKLAVKIVQKMESEIGAKAEQKDAQAEDNRD